MAGTARRVPWAAVATLAGAAALATLAGWLATVSLQQDFAAYYTAGRARALGLDPYVNHLGTGGPWDGVAVYRHSRFLYPPLVADLFRPLAALPFAWAKLLFTAGSVLALALGLHLSVRDARASGMRDWPPTGVALLLAAAWPPVFAALERGQIDLLLFPLLVAAWKWRERPLRAGLALAICVLGKPLLIALLPLLLLARRTRWAGAMAAALPLLALVSVALGGLALNRTYLTQVLPRAARYGEGGPEAWMLDTPALAAVTDDLESGTARIDGRLYDQQIGDFPRNASLARLVVGSATPAVLPPVTVALLAVGGLALAIAAFRRPGAGGWYWGGLLLAVLAAPVSWAMSLVWGLPLVGALVPAVRARRRAWAGALALACGLGLVGPWLPGAWCLVGVAGVAAAVLWPAPEPR